MISVVVPSRGSHDLGDCLESLKRQTRKAGEIVVVADKPSAAARKYGARVVIDRHGTIGGAYFTGAKAARGDIVAFLDDDCIAPPNWLEKIGKEFSEDIDIVSGEDVLPENSSFFQRAAYQIDKARIMQEVVYDEKAKNRLRGANIAYSKRVFEKENFNPKLEGLQEPEFHHRLFKAGFKMKFNPRLHVYHKRRSSLESIFRQIYRNGKAKIELLKLHGDMLSFIDVFPFLYLSFSLIMAYSALKFGNWLFFYLWLAATAAYFLLKPLVIVARTGEIKYYPLLVFIIIVREVAYSLGIVAGMKGIFKR